MIYLSQARTAAGSSSSLGNSLLLLLLLLFVSFPRCAVFGRQKRRSEQQAGASRSFVAVATAADASQTQLA
jgi:hypothetical protein